jgi:hypothetical protein
MIALLISSSTSTYQSYGVTESMDAMMEEMTAPHAMIAAALCAKRVLERALVSEHHLAV